MKKKLQKVPQEALRQVPPLVSMLWMLCTLRPPESAVATDSPRSERNAWDAEAAVLIDFTIKRRNGLQPEEVRRSVALINPSSADARL